MDFLSEGSGKSPSFSTLTKAAAENDPALVATRTWDTTRDVLLTIENNAGETVRSPYTCTVNDIGPRTAVNTGESEFTGPPADCSWRYDALGQLEMAALGATGNNGSNYQYAAIRGQFTANSVHDYDGDGHARSRVPAGRPSRQNRLVSSRSVGVPPTSTTRYLYDGWNRIAEYDGAGALQDTFTRGLDLSGSKQGAGGVGGFLSTRWASASGSPFYYPTYNGNGNISEYLAAAAHFEYDPFGILTRLTGSNSTRFQHRFSTKPRDPDSGLCCYGYRWCDPLTGRSPSRDPMGERGGLNLYGYVGNDSINALDYVGLAPLEGCAGWKEESKGCGCDLKVNVDKAEYSVLEGRKTTWVQLEFKVTCEINKISID
ncbi:MAG: RHS repeat-associated core domain-containing protein [Verrucomicrobia bacterium]|nr:RHS repeat-associated core domain-containing protein [Verrucomicrobiota bacterium]